MQFGAMDMFLEQEKRNSTRDVLLGLGGATLYTVIITALVYFHVLEPPTFH